MKYKIGFLALSISAGAFMFSCSKAEQPAMTQMPAIDTDFIQLKNGNADVSTGYPGSIEDRIM